MTIPQTNPKANYLTHRAAIDDAVHRVLNSGWYILGQEVEAFEREFAIYIGVGHAVGVGNGTDALSLALQACGIGKGDLVFTVSHTAVATVAAIELIGAKPVLVDIDLATYTIDPERLAEAIEEHGNKGRPAAVVPVHLYGHPADMSSILSIARNHNLFVVEDCAQSHGAMFHDRKTGAWGDMAAFSFYPTKNLGALGDGGIIVARDADLIKRVRLLRQYGWRQRYISEHSGGNSRLDEMQAAILRVKLQHLDQENIRRNTIANTYNRILADTDLVLPVCRHGSTHVFHQYVIRTPRRDALQAYLHEQDIGALIHYPQAVHQQPYYQGRLMGSSGLPHSELAAAQVISLPMYPEMLEEEVGRVAEVVRWWCEHA
ncbi:MAG: DegT/DnrJ/EryC1/StrS family aminotransferase [Chloroflexota bacterium]